MRRFAVPALALILVLPGSGCIGKFALTQKIYEFNKEISPDLIVQELLFLGLNIIPVYGVGVFIDAFVLNIVETFTGSNPISGNEAETRVVDLGDEGLLYMIPRGRKLRLEHVVDGETTVFFLRRTADATELLDAGEQVIRRVQSTADGSVLVEDGRGQLLESYDRREVLAATTAWYTGGTSAVAATLQSSPLLTASLH